MYKHVHTQKHTQTHKSKKKTEKKEGRQNIQGEVTKSSKLSPHSCYLESTRRPQREDTSAVGNSVSGDCHLITSVECKFKNSNTRVTGCGWALTNWSFLSENGIALWKHQLLLPLVVVLFPAPAETRWWASLLPPTPRGIYLTAPELGVGTEITCKPEEACSNNTRSFIKKETTRGVKRLSGKWGVRVGWMCEYTCVIVHLCVCWVMCKCVCVVGMHAPVTERCECVFAYLREYTLSSVCVWMCSGQFVTEQCVFYWVVYEFLGAHVMSCVCAHVLLESVCVCVW